MPTPSGPLSLHIEALRTLLSQSSNFQTAVGEATAGDALDHIYYVELGSLITTTAGRAIVGIINGYRYRFGAGRWELSGRSNNTDAPVGFFLDLPVPEDYLDDPNDSLLDFRNRVGAILGDLMTLRLASAALDTREIAPVPHESGALNLEQLYTEQTDEGPVKYWRVLIAVEIRGNAT